MKCDGGDRVSMTIEFQVCVHYLQWNAKVFTIETHADLDVLNQALNHHDSTCLIMCVAFDCQAHLLLHPRPCDPTIPMFVLYTPPKINMSPENLTTSKEISFSAHQYSGHIPSLKLT